MQRNFFQLREGSVNMHCLSLNLLLFDIFLKIGESFFCKSRPLFRADSASSFAISILQNNHKLWIIEALCCRVFSSRLQLTIRFEKRTRTFSSTAYCAVHVAFDRFQFHFLILLPAFRNRSDGGGFAIFALTLQSQRDFFKSKSNSPSQ